MTEASKDRESQKEAFVGLSPEHHIELNGFRIPAGASEGLRQDLRGIYTKLKILYQNDLLALEQIDIYDKESPYCINLKRYVSALKADDTVATEELEAWFKEHYPLTESGLGR